MQRYNDNGKFVIGNPLIINPLTVMVNFNPITVNPLMTNPFMITVNAMMSINQIFILLCGTRGSYFCKIKQILLLGSTIIFLQML